MYSGDNFYNIAIDGLILDPCITVLHLSFVITNKFYSYGKHGRSTVKPVLLDSHQLYS